MIPAFQTTTVLADSAPDSPVESLPRAVVRLCQAAAAALAVSALVLAVMATMSPPQAQPEAAFLCALGSLGLLRIAAAAHRRALAAKQWLDPATGLCNRAGLAAVGDPLLARARRNGQPLTAIVLDFADLLEVREIYGRELTQRLLTRVVRKMQTLAGPYGVPVRTGRAQFTVLVPGADMEKAQTLVHRALGKPCRIEFDAGDSEIVLVPDIAAATAAEDLQSVAELYRELAGRLAERRDYEQRRRHWLQRERERHSRPMNLAA